MNSLDARFVTYGYLDINYLPGEAGVVSAGYVLESDFNILNNLIGRYNRRRCNPNERLRGKTFLLQRYILGRSGYLQRNGQPISLEPYKMGSAALLDRRQAGVPED